MPGPDGWGALGRWRRRRRLTRLLAELDQLDREQAGSTVQLSRGRRLSERMRTVVAVVAVAALLLVAWQVNGPLRPPSSGSRDLDVRIAPSGPLGHGLERPDQVETGDGAYRFSLVRSDGSPVAYAACRPVQLVVNPDGGPPGADDLLDEATDEVSEATGLTVEVVGESDARPSDERELVLEGDDPPPSLVSWSDPQESPRLEGAVAGYAGSGWIRRGDETAYASGEVTFDAAQVGDLVNGGEWDAARGIVVHELAHLLGLGHVDDPTQLMYPESQRNVTSLQGGDRAGLAALGDGPCVDW